MRPQVYVMLKEPHAGRVKTRLGRDIGMVPAAWWFRHQVRRILRRLEDPRWDLILAVSPDIEGLESRIWPDHFDRVAQGTGTLGDRMKRIFQTAPKGPVLIIGTDIPDISKHHIRAAFRALGRSDAVIGPAPDGGFWLIGMTRLRAVHNQLFDKVRWSSEHTLKDTLKTLPDKRITYLETLEDVDTIDDLRALTQQG
ncbi:MAG: TIGR04282 family arsenosugar biosynthesis glycosyltransferase [Halocynthiibacter sp.]